LSGRARSAVELLSTAKIEGGIPVLISWVRANATISLSICVSVKAVQSRVRQALTHRLARSSVRLPRKAFVSRGIPIEGSKITAVASVEGSIPVLISWVRASAIIDLSICVSVKAVQSSVRQALVHQLARSPVRLPGCALICCSVPEELIRQ